MQGLFSPDSRFMQGMSRAADLMILNLLFLLTSVPVVTAGPAACAMYRVIFAMGTSRESGVLKSYFRAFRENFGAALRIWLLLLAVGAALGADIFLFACFGGLVSAFSVIFWALLAVEFLAACMIFPLISLFQNSMLQTVKNGLALAFGYLPRAAAVLVMWLFPVVMLLRFPLVFFYAAFIWIVIYFSAAAYLSGLLLRKVFAPFVPEDMLQEETK